MCRLMVAVSIIFGVSIALTGVNTAAQQTAGSMQPLPASMSRFPSTATTDKLSPRLKILSELAGSGRRLTTVDEASLLNIASSGPGSLLQTATGDLLVFARMNDISAAGLVQLHTAGASLVNLAPEFDVATITAPRSALQNIAAIPAVDYLWEEYTPMTGSFSPRRQNDQSQSSAIHAPSISACPSGVAVTDGITQLNVLQARSAYSVTGSGVTVGVLSDSFNQYVFAHTTEATDISTGDLPGAGNPCGYLTPVGVYTTSIYYSSYDEGRAMTQIIHDIAPAAHLRFASAFNGIFEFSDSIQALRNLGSDIIVDDVFYYDDPFFQDGPISVAISDVVASGATYFTLAGNHDMQVGGNPVGSYEAPAYTPAACPLLAVSSFTGTCHNFNLGVGGVNTGSTITVAAAGQVNVILQWAEPWSGVSTDLDFYLIDNLGNIIVSSANNNPTGTHEPFEYFNYYNNTGLQRVMRLVINRPGSTGTPRLKYLFTQSSYSFSGVQYAVSKGSYIVGPTVYGHSGASDAISAAAISYSTNNSPETFTSRGPSTVYFGPVNGNIPASALGSPSVRQKPDLAATDGGCTTFFPYYGTLCPNGYRFTGTSAAGPHGAGVAALMLEWARAHNAVLTAAQIKSYLASSARSVATDGSAQKVGAGLIDAFAAIKKMIVPRAFLPLSAKSY